MQQSTGFNYGMTALLILALAASAMAVVNFQHQSRKLYAANERAVGQLRQLDAELEALVVQQRKLAAPQRIEVLARTRMSMQPISAARTLTVVHNIIPSTKQGR